MYEKLVKVIDALEHCVKIDCNHCPYRGDDNGGWNCHEMQKDAIELLKEQEHKDRMFHALEDDWKRLKELLKEQHEKIKNLESLRSIENGEGWG